MMASGYQGTPQFNVILLGDPGVGKTTYLTRFETGSFEKNHIPTNGIKENSLAINTTRGEVIFKVKEIKPKKRSTRSGVDTAEQYLDADAGLIMYDMSLARTYKSVPIWHSDISNCSPDLPLYIVGNKLDLHTKVNRISFRPKETIQISVKTNFNIVAPFLLLARRLLRDPDLEIVNAAAHPPPEVLLSAEQVQELHQDIDIEEPLSDEDDF